MDIETNNNVLVKLPKNDISVSYKTMVNESLEIQTINYQNLKSNTIEIQNSEIVYN